MNTRTRIAIAGVGMVFLAALIARGQIAGVAIFRIFTQVEAGWAYFSQDGAGVHNGSWGNELSLGEARSQSSIVRLYPISGTYSGFSPSLVITQPTTQPEAFMDATGEPQYWIYILPDQIP